MQDHGRHLRHRRRLREVLRRRDRHHRRLAPDRAGRGEGLREGQSINYEEVQVANDGIAVVVNPENDWAECLTTAELKKIWDKGSDGRTTGTRSTPSLPGRELKLFGAGTDSGTFDYFTEQINGEEGASRSDYSPSEDDNVTVQGVVRRQGRPRLLRALLRRAERGQAEDGPGRRRRRLRRRRPHETVQDGTLQAALAGRCSSTRRRRRSQRAGGRARS